MNEKIERARAALKELEKNHVVTLKTIDYIRGLFDDIEAIRISKKAKTKDIYNTLSSHLNGMTYESFTSSLSKIRKEKKEDELIISKAKTVE
jgi:hypothetical protein